MVFNNDNYISSIRVNIISSQFNNVESLLTTVDNRLRIVKILIKQILQNLNLNLTGK